MARKAVRIYAVGIFDAYKSRDIGVGLVRESIYPTFIRRILISTSITSRASCHQRLFRPHPCTTNTTPRHTPCYSTPKCPICRNILLFAIGSIILAFCSFHFLLRGGGCLYRSFVTYVMISLCKQHYTMRHTISSSHTSSDS